LGVREGGGEKGKKRARLCRNILSLRLHTRIKESKRHKVDHELGEEGNRMKENGPYLQFLKRISAGGGGGRPSQEIKGEGGRGGDTEKGFHAPTVRVG